ERSNSLKDNIIFGLPPCSAITPNEPVLSTEEPDNSLSMGDEHLDTISTTELDEVINSSVEDLIPIPNESEDEFTGELTLLKSIPPGIDETDCNFKEDIRLIEKLLYDNSSLRPSKKLVSANSDAEIESFSPSPILVKDNYPMPPDIDDDDYDSERDILILKDLPSNHALSFAEKESFHFDIPLFS
nr:hypothetical protein [Tanacetum cinerariifolium]